MRLRKIRKSGRAKEAMAKQKDAASIDVAPRWPRFLYLVDIEQVRRTPPAQLQNLLTRCERINYKDWSEAKKRRARRKPQKWYLVLNPPEPFLAVTMERLVSSGLGF
jgi:hypothetical protein